MKMLKFLTTFVVLTLMAGLSGCSGGNDSNSSLNKSTARLLNYSSGQSEIKVSVASDDQSNPQVVYLADKKLYFVVWEDWRSRDLTTTDFPADPAKFAGADIWGKFLNLDGKPCGSEFAITNRLSGNQTAPTVAYRPGDKLLVAWQDSIGSATGGYIGYASVTSIPSSVSCATAAPAVSAPVQPGFNHFKQYDSLTLIPDSTTFTIVGDTTAGTDVTGGAVLTPYVSPRSITITGSYPAENNLASAGSATPVNIQDDGLGKLIGSGASGTINYMTGKLDVTLINEVDTGATATFTVNYKRLGRTATNMPESLQSRKTPKANFDAVKDQFALTWVESRIDKTGTSNYGNSYASVLCFGVAPVTWRTGDSTFLGYLYLDAALAPIANSLAIANADVIRSEITTSMKLVETSRTATIETYVYDYFTNLNNPNLSSDNTSPETLFVWEGERQSSTVKCSLDAATGTITSTFTSAPKEDGKVHIYGMFDKEIILNTPPKWIDKGNTSGTGSNPALAVDNASVPRKFLVAWEDNRGGANTKIFGQLVNSGGGLYNDNRMLSFQDSTGTIPPVNDAVITNSRQTKPVVSFDADAQRYFVMWQDARNGSVSAANIDLYGQYVNLEGSPSGANYSISSNLSNQLAPAIAYDSLTKQFLAVWKDARNSTTTASDVYGQLFSLGQPQLTLLTTTTPVAPLVPSVHDFGAVNTGTTVTWPFVVKNTGDTALNIDAITDLPNNPFTIAPTNKVVLAPGSSATYTVTYLPTSSGTYNSSFTLKSDGGNQTVALSATGVPVGANTLNISTPASTSLPDAPVAGLYSVQIISAGGYTPFTWGLSASNSVTGAAWNQLSIDGTGKITGSNLAPGAYTVNVTVSDGSATPLQASRTYSLKVGAIQINTTPLSAWTQNIEYFNSPVHSVSGAGGTGSLAWLWSGSTPPGLDMNSAGQISGAVTSSGQYSFTVTATDQSSPAQSVSSPFSITINPPPKVFTSSLSNGIVGLPYSQTVNITGGTVPLTLAVAGGLPPGLSFNTSTGEISGTPTQEGVNAFDVSVTDRAGVSVSAPLSLTVVAQLSLSSMTLPDATIATKYPNTTLIPVGGREPYTGWKIESGTFPTGLALSSTGIISGTPSELGTFKFTVQVSDADGKTAGQLLTIVVNNVGGGSAPGGTNTTTTTDPLKITTTAFSNAATGTKYEKGLAVTGGRLPYLYALSKGALPAGLALDVNTGKITGTPSASGTYSFIITVTDADDRLAAATYSVIVGSGTAAVTQTSGSGTLSSFRNSTKSELATAGAPADFKAVDGVNFIVTNITAGTTVSTEIDFGTLPTNPVFYKIVNGAWLKMTSGTDYTLSGTKLTVSIKDKVSAVDNTAPFDSDPAPGIINDPIIVGTSVTPSGTGSTDNATNSAPASGGGSGSGCFIATAAFGSYLDPHVMVLRHFRDDVLLQSEFGTAFVKFYYKHSPPIADFIARHDTLRMFFRFALTPLIFAVKYPLAASFLLVFAGLGVIRRRVALRTREEILHQAG